MCQTRESIIGHRYERTNVGGKCELYELWLEVHSHLQKKSNMVPKHGILKGDRCEWTNVAYKCKLFEAVKFTLHGH